MESQSFEAKLAHAKEILEKLMNPEVTLEESVVLYQDGLSLLKEAQELLQEAQLKIETIEQSMLGDK